MHEATLATVNLSSAERDLAPWDDHQQLRRPAAVFRHERGDFPVGSDLQLCGSGSRGVAPSLSPAETHCLAPPHSTTGHRDDVSTGRYHD
jgi:hypothetical protein